MKKIFIGILMIAMVLVSASTATINLTGTVGNNINISVVEKNLPLDLTVDTTDLVVGTVTEKSNKDGYSVEISSDNSGKLIGVNGEELTYTAKYDGVSFNLSSTAVEVVASGTKTSGTDKDVSISYSATPYTLSPDTYTDTLTLTIIAN